jgi:breast cancer 2 susceptibility protein
VANLAQLIPEDEREPETRRWGWKHVMEQLLYRYARLLLLLYPVVILTSGRYEREINRGVRPPLRLIAAQDRPASCPMVLCISDILNNAEGNPEIEVTDGWYVMRAQVDGPLARAVRKRKLCVGRKIAVVGCSVGTFCRL